MEKNEYELKIFTDAILASAKGETDEIMKAVNARRQKAIADAEDRILNESYRHIQDEVALIRAREGERVSHKDLECKQAFFSRREEITREIMAEVKGRLADYVKSDKYKPLLMEIGKKLADKVGDSDVTLAIRREDEALQGEISTLFLGKTVFELGGVRYGGMTAIPAGTNKCYDESFDVNLDDVNERILEIIGLGL